MTAEYASRSAYWFAYQSQVPGLFLHPSFQDFIMLTVYPALAPHLIPPPRPLLMESVSMTSFFVPSLVRWKCVFR